jgi:hypothetical protein
LGFRGRVLHSLYHPERVISLPQARLAALADQWQFLVQKSAEKSQKLKEANKQQNFNTGIKDFDFWLSEVMQSGSLFPQMEFLASQQAPN